MFEGSELVVTSYDSARGEFNIAFTNLTQEAKQLLDSQRASLMRDLADSGYVAHIVVVTTEALQTNDGGKTNHKQVNSSKMLETTQRAERPRTRTPARTAATRIITELRKGTQIRGSNDKILRLA